MQATRGPLTWVATAAVLVVAAQAGACHFTVTHPSLPLAAEPPAEAEAPAGTELAFLPASSASALVAEAPPLVAEAPPLVAEAPPLVVGPDIRISDVVGLSPASAGVLFAPVTEPIEQCLPEGGGLMRVRLAATPGGTAFEVDPDTEVDEATRRCVLEALSTADLDDVMPGAVSPTDTPPRIESQLTIRW